MLRLAAIPALLMALSLPAHAAGSCRADAIETQHHATIGGKRIDYVACAGTLPVRNLKGEAHGRVFYTAYIVPKAKAAKRPLTFVWNGGPGADSRLLHFHALGPRVIAKGALVDNAVSPLAASDLVFVDPVGTGFSRADTPELAAGFYGTRADIASISGFIQDWRKIYARGAAPLYLAGESFGTWRAAGVAETLVDAGVKVSGMALISGGIPLGDMPDRNLMRALSLDSRIVTAHALGRLHPEADLPALLKEARIWGKDVYAPALAAPDSLSSDERTAVIERLARYQGLDPAVIDPKTLWVSPRQFRTALLASQNKTLDVFDMRKSSPAPDESAENALVLDYYRTALGYREGAYAGIDAPAADAGNKWEYDQSPITKESLARAMAGEGPPSPSQPWTLRAMEKAPAMRTWVAAGHYDSLNSCAGNEATVAALPKGVAARFVLRCYEGGHMMYEDERETLRFGRDLSSFIKGDA